MSRDNLRSVSNVNAIARQRAARNERIDSALVNLNSLRGVTAAAVVDSDGLVTHIRRDFEVNTDALGAGVQVVLGAAQRASENVDQETTKMIICENKEGYILLSPIAKGLLLVMVADSDALLGTIRFELKETLPALVQVFTTRG